MARRVARTGPYRRKHHVVQTSGGLGSWATGMRVREKYGTENLHLLFADTFIEDDDLYRFLIEGSALVLDLPIPAGLVEHTYHLPSVTEDLEARKRELLSIATAANEALPGLHWIAEGRDPWEVFRDVRFIGNARIDPCSDKLKRSFLRAWMEENFSPLFTTAYIGIDWTEDHRFKKAKDRWAPWHVEAPLCEPPLHAKSTFTADLESRGVKKPRMYDEGFPHNNCGGFCIKAGMAHFKLLAQERPEIYAHHEKQEAEFREFLGKDVAVLRDRSKVARDANDGKAKPLPLSEFRQRLIDGGEIDEFDWGGCGCAI